METPPVNCEE